MIDFETAVSIKADLWAGEGVPFVAKKHRLSIPAIYHIRKGVRWNAAPWPDKSTGGMPAARVAKIAKARRGASNSVRVT